MTPSRIFLYFCLSFIGGIFFSSFLKTPQIFIVAILISGILLSLASWPHKALLIIGFCLLFLVLGIWRHQGGESRVINSELEKLNDSNQKITLFGLILNEPDIGGKSVKLTIGNLEIKTEAGLLPVEGKILATTNRYPEYKYGDKLKITGELKSPPILEGFNYTSGDNFTTFNYKDYLKKDGIFSIMEWPKIELVGSGFGNPAMKILFSFKNKLKESIRQAMPLPQSGLLEALFFGEEGELSKDWKEKFNLTGTRHITAVSGMNITIISALLLNFLLALGFWRGQAFYFSIFLILLYILMIGAPSSAVRAGIMGGLFLMAQHFGRLSLAARAIVFAAALMLFQNPFLLKLDVGFQLSFLAMMGLIYFQPLFLNLLKKIPDILQLRYTLAATISAQIFTLPLLIYNFGRVPVVGPIANVLIVPFLPLITILGFIFSFLGIFWQALGQILSWPAWTALTYLIKTIDFFSRIPWASLTIEKVHWIWITVFYLILGLLVRRLKEKEKLRFLNY